MTFADAFDLAHTIKCDIQILISRHIELSLMNDSLSLFDVLTKSTTTTEKTLMIDSQTIKDSYQKLELNNVAFLQSICILTDSLSKMKQSHFLSKVLSTSVIGHPIEQWMIRNGIADGLVKKNGKIMKQRAVIATHLR